MMCISHYLAQVSACAGHSISMSSMMSGWAFVCSSLCLRSDFLRVSLLHPALLFPLLPVLWPELLLPCGQRQGNCSLCLRQQRSLALWQDTLLPQSWRPWGHRGVRRRWWRPTARCEQDKEATVYVKQLDLFVTFMILEETPEVLSLRKFCEDHGYTYYWTSCQKPHLTQKGKRIDCNISNYVPFVVPGLSTSFLYNAHTYFSNIFITGLRFLTLADTQKIQYPKRSGSTSEGATGKPAAWTNRNRKHKSKWRTRRSTDRSIAWLAGLATGV